MGRYIVILIICLCFFSLRSQSKKELKEQNDELVKMYNDLNDEKRKVEKEKRLLENERRNLVNKTKSLHRVVKKKQRELKLTSKEVELRKNMLQQQSDEIVEITNEIKRKDADISNLEERKKMSDILIKKNELELEHKRSQQKFLILGLSLVVLISLLLLFITVNRRRVNKILEIEKKKSDALLLNILPREIAIELKNTSKTVARSYELATVMFADIKNFTKLSAQLSPSDLIEELDYLFGAFDKIILKYNIEKIKIIGDCYMCVGGIPQANDTNPLDIVHAAIEMQDFMTAMREDRLKNGGLIYDIRIGINTGPIVAGVIGSMKFAYDVWGHTVNIASRLEAACEARKINISSSTYECIQDKFECTYRGRMDVKGKSGLEMYYVSGVLPDNEIRDYKPLAV